MNFENPTCFGAENGEFGYFTQKKKTPLAKEIRWEGENNERFWRIPPEYLKKKRINGTINLYDTAYNHRKGYKDV